MSDAVEGSAPATTAPTSATTARTVFDILDAVSDALGVVQRVAETPGVSAIPYVSTAAFAIGALRTAYAAGRNILPYVEAIRGTFDPATAPPTADALVALNVRIAVLETQIDAPLPPAEPGEPE